MNTSPNSLDEDDALAAEYVVGVLSHSEREEVEARLRRDVAFSDRVTRWEMRLDGLNNEYGHLEPPARVKARIDRILFEAAPARRMFPLWRAGLAAVLGVFLILAFWQFGDPVDPDLRAVLQGERGEITVDIGPENTGLRVSLGATPPPNGSVYELWLVPDGNAPVSLGTFAADRTLPLGRTLNTGATLAVSIEPTGGSPTGAPTGPVIAIGALEDV